MNKVLICILLIFSTLISQSQTEKRPPNSPRGIKNKRDELDRKQETWRSYSFDGDLMSEIDYKNGKMEGKYTTYYIGGGSKGGKIRESAQYFDGKKDGPYIKNYLSGQAAMEGEFSLGKKVGRWTTYYEDGQVRDEGEFLLNRKEGLWKTYNRKGVLLSSIVYKNGVNVVAAEKAQQVAQQKKEEKDKLDKTKKKTNPK